MVEAGKEGQVVEGTSLSVQVCYAMLDYQFLRELRVPAGSTVRDAIVLSGVAEYLEEESADNCKVGIYGKLMTPDTVLRERDRIEIYRPLKADPKEARRRRAEKKKAGKP